MASFVMFDVMIYECRPWNMWPVGSWRGLFLTTTNWVRVAGISVKFSARVSASTISIPCLTLFEDDEVLGNLAQISQLISQSPEKAWQIVKFFQMQCCFALQVTSLSYSSRSTKERTIFVYVCYLVKSRLASFCLRVNKVRWWEFSSSRL